MQMQIYFRSEFNFLRGKKRIPTENTSQKKKHNEAESIKF